ncbi:MAG: hypothetical protein J4473_02640 [Candidatus Aenigmarchaeota archaeon]|nr:hypothetical protein [Candidatus Aenigmarchaeota archaeon]
MKRFFPSWLTISIIIIFPLFSSISFAVIDAIEFRNETGTITSARPWDNVTVQITNSAMNKNSAVREAVHAVIASDKSSIVVTFTETSDNSGIFQGYFYPYEGGTAENLEYLSVSRNAKINVTVDLDNDNSSGSSLIDFITSPEKITIYKDENYNQNTTRFDINDTIFIEVISSTSQTRQATLSNGQIVSLTEPITNKYRGFINITSGIIKPGNCTIVASNQSVVVCVRDLIKTYDESYEKEKTYYKWGKTVYIRVNNTLKNQNPNAVETGSITVNSTADATGISLTLTETGADSGVFQGSFVVNESSIAGSQLRTSSTDTISIMADLDNNDPTDAKKNIFVDNTKPVILWYAPTGLYNKSSNNKTLYFNASDNNVLNVSAVLFYWRLNKIEDYDYDGLQDNGEWISINTTGLGSNQSRLYTFSIDDSGMSTGQNVSFWISIEDEAGNMASGGNWTDPLRIYKLDNTMPFDFRIVNINPLDLILDKLTINVTWNDTDSGINKNSAEYFIRNEYDVIERSGSLAGCSVTGCYVENMDIKNISYGKPTLIIGIEDNVRNYITYSVDFFHRPTLPPKVYKTSFIVSKTDNKLILQQSEKKDVVISVVNNGDLTLKNLIMNISGVDFYNISTVPLGNLSVNERANFIIDFFPSENEPIAEKKASIKISAESSAEALSNTTEIYIRIVPSKKLQAEIKNRYHEFSNEIKSIGSKIEESKAESAKSLLNRTIEEMKIMEASMNEDYFVAYSIQASIQKNIKSLNELLAGQPEAFDTGLLIIVTVTIAGSGLLIYLFWPSREEESYEIQ